MLFGMFALIGHDGRDDKLQYRHRQTASTMASDAGIAGELKKHASAFFGKI